MYWKLSLAFNPVFGRHPSDQYSAEKLVWKWATGNVKFRESPAMAKNLTLAPESKDICVVEVAKGTGTSPYFPCIQNAWLVKILCSIWGVMFLVPLNVRQQQHNFCSTMNIHHIFTILHVRSVLGNLSMDCFECGGVEATAYSTVGTPHGKQMRE